jgi:uncharacterized protein (DUF1330 family)
MAAYCIFDIREIVDREKMAKYRAGVSPTVEKFGGRYLALGGPFDVVEGDWKPVFPVIIEFPTLERAHEWYESEDYAEMLRLRLEGSRGSAVFIDGKK